MAKIKNFSEYMTSLGSKIRRSLNHLIIECNIKSWFFSKPKVGEVHIYYSNKKEAILEIRLDSQDLNLEDLDITFRVGDNIDSVYKWIESNGHKIIADFKK